MAKRKYIDQVKLMLDSLPIVFSVEGFALKGGTAINFFYQNMPRLSVDIDLTYVPLTPREEALLDIESKLKTISKEIEKSLPGTNVIESKSKEDIVSKLVVTRGQVVIKIEPNPVLRSVVHPVEMRELSEKVQEQFESYVEVPTLSYEDLYGGKICAALDRQHPRDLFDIKYLFEEKGFTENVRKTFLVYLLSHPRPIHEVIRPNFKDISEIYEKDFVGMVEEAVSLDELLHCREKLVDEILNKLTDDERQFLLSFQDGKPNWSFFEYDIMNMPGILWKIKNIEKLKSENPVRHQNLQAALKEKLGL